MKIILTGATGGLGKSAIEYLLGLPEVDTIIAVGRNLKEIPKNSRVVPVLLNLSSDKDIEFFCETHLRGATAIWHCAALSSPWGKFSDFFQINVTATLNLFEQAIKHCVPSFVHISTPAVYFDFKKQYGIKEQDVPTDQVGLYAKTKRMAEIALAKKVSSNTQFPTKLSILRPRAIVSKYDTVLLPRLLKTAVVNGTNVDIKLPNGGDVLLDITPAKTVCHAMYCAQQRNTENISIFNVSNDQPVILKKCLTSLFKGAGFDLRIKNVPYSIARPLASVLEAISHVSGKEPVITPYSLGVLCYDMTLDVALIKKQLGFKPYIILDEELAHMRDWLKIKLDNKLGYK